MEGTILDAQIKIYVCYAIIAFGGVLVVIGTAASNYYKDRREKEVQSNEQIRQSEEKVTFRKERIKIIGPQVYTVKTGEMTYRAGIEFLLINTDATETLVFIEPEYDTAFQFHKDCTKHNFVPFFDKSNKDIFPTILPAGETIRIKELFPVDVVLEEHCEFPFRIISFTLKLNNEINFNIDISKDMFKGLIDLENWNNHNAY